jgi:adenylylsulfate kinase
MCDRDTRFSLFIGRWQPFHEGHKKLIQTVIDEGKRVCIAIRDTPIDENNPYSASERYAMIKNALPEARVIVIPDIDEVCIGRKVGYDIREIRLDEETEAISGTEIRKCST